MINIKTAKELELMRVACRITALARKAAADAVAPGVTTDDVDRAVRKTIEDAGAKPSFLGYGGFPASACVSINDEVIHGIPSKKRVIHEGDIVKVDVGAYIHGFHGDCACTVPCGKVSGEAVKLIEVTRQSFYEGIKFARVGNRISDISSAVQAYVEAQGFSVVRDFVGHGVGAQLVAELIRQRRVDHDELKVGFQHPPPRLRRTWYDDGPRIAQLRQACGDIFVGACARAYDQGTSHSAHSFPMSFCIRWH